MEIYVAPAGHIAVFKHHTGSQPWLNVSVNQGNSFLNLVVPDTDAVRLCQTILKASGRKDLSNMLDAEAV